MCFDCTLVNLEIRKIRLDTNLFLYFVLETKFQLSLVFRSNGLSIFELICINWFGTENIDNYLNLINKLT